MDNVIDIVNYALDKNASGMKSALETEMSSRIVDRLDAMRVDVASSLFGSTTGEDIPVVEEPSIEDNIVDNSTVETISTETEGTTDENL